MDCDAKLRPLYLAKILYEMTDEDHYLTTAQLIQLLEEKYGIKAHRQTIKAEVELLKQFGLEIEEVKSTQNRYNLYGRTFDIPELKLLIDAVESSKFISASKSMELVKKLSSLTSNQIASTLTRNVSCEGRIKSGNEKIYLIIDTINEAINSNRQISFQYFQYNVRKEQQLKHNGEPYVITPLHLVWNGDYYYIFPRAYLKKNGVDSKVKYNQVANYIYLDTQVNKAISDNAPCDYFSKVKTQCEGGQIEFGNISDAELLSKNLEENCIPADIVDMDVSRYDEFLQQRRKMMARLIERYYKNL